jgi:amino acid adenylation domain-containing protein
MGLHPRHREGEAAPASVLPRGPFAVFPPEAVEQSIARRFEEQVDRDADRTAVVAGGERLTYAELDGWANRIASALLEQRGPGQEPVGLLLGQGAPAVAAILGVLKAGKIYVPLDPAHPRPRLAGMLEWAGAGAVLSGPAHAALARSLAGDGSQLLDADRLRKSVDAPRPGLPVTPDAVAYVFFTSGTTGRPKGVFDSQRNVLHNVRRYTNALAIGPDDRLTLLQSPAFSGSVSSLFAALLNGATVYPFDLNAEGPGRLADLLVRERLTMYHSVPAIFRAAVTGARRFPDLRVIRLEGDRASSLDAALYRRHFDPECVLANGLGTTETGLCRQYLVDRSTYVEEGILPVGYPVPELEVELLAEDGRAAGPGERGEIAVRSRYLALGYWRRPDLTERAFSGEGESRVYRTGDVGRLRPDGCLEYLARTDFQLKVRGHRVDVADVESELIAAAGVRDAVVATREKAGGDAELVAYVVASDGAALDEAALRSALGRRLPAYLVPARFVRLDALPLDGSGKVDRRALPGPGPVSRRQRQAPRDELERQVAAIWQEVLGAGPVGVDESFVELGGDSLGAAVIAARIESETGRRVTPGALAECSTVAALAEALRAEPGRALVALQPQGSAPPLFLVHDLLGEVARYGELARCLGPDRPVWGLRCASDPDTIESMAGRYLEEIRGVRPSGPYRLGGWCFGGVVAFEIAHRLRAAGEEVELLALLGISAWDFPRLVSPEAWRRYRAGRRDRLAAVRRLVRRRPPGIQTMSEDAFARYVPRPYPGRALLVLSADETAAYSGDPESDWRGLCAEGVEVLLLPGPHGAVLAGENARMVANVLGR